MLLEIALLLSMVIQLGTAIIAVGMIKRTKFNVSWILISVGFVIMSFRRFVDLAPLLWEDSYPVVGDLNVWAGVMVSVLMFIAIFYIRRIFDFQDLLDKMRTQSENRLLSAVIKGEEKVRESIAVDLHDGIAPLLSSLKMILSSTDLDKMDSENRKTIEKGYYVIDEAITALKEISNQLSPHLLKNYGIKSAVNSIIAPITGCSNLKLSLDIDIGEKRYYPDLEISIYRIVAELLNNTIKHAKATSVILKIGENDGVFYVQYCDDGCGFDMDGFINGKHRGMGLESIRSRVKSLGGSCEFESAKDKGFSVKIQLPLIPVGS
ncbi:MAG: sensor histidine kinase [Bacteroidia bacterium]|nr:sensor histidine kinase [Bacteroidia bacterium]